MNNWHSLHLPLQLLHSVELLRKNAVIDALKLLGMLKLLLLVSLLVAPGLRRLVTPSGFLWVLLQCRRILHWLWLLLSKDVSSCQFSTHFLIVIFINIVLFVAILALILLLIRHALFWRVLD